MEEELLCPKCKCEMTIYWSGKPEFPSDCYVPHKVICPNCDKRYYVQEVFQFVGWEEMEEMTHE